MDLDLSVGGDAMIVPVREVTRPRWKRVLWRCWRFLFRWNEDLYQIDWTTRPEVVRWEIGYALRIRDQCEGDWYANGWWCWPWRHSVVRFWRYRKSQDVMTALRWINQDREIEAARRGITPTKRPEGY